MTEQDATIDWSYSNARRYASCPRSLFLHHRQQVKSAEASDEKNDAELRESTGSAGAIIGSAIHKALEEHIRCWAQNERTGMKQTQSVAKSYIQDSFSPGQGSTLSGSSSLIETADVHLEEFFKTVWPSVRSQRYILHEEKRSFKIGGARVWVRPDLCVRESSAEDSGADTFVIYDWKSRQPDTFEEPSLQLYVYALWAHRKFEPDIEKISPRIVFTKNGHIKRQSVSAQDLKRIKTRINNDVREWNPPDCKSSFPTKPAPKKCQTCPYLSECSDGQQEVNSL